MLVYATICQDNKRSDSPKNLYISREISNFKEFQIDDKNFVRLPRQYVLKC